MGRNIPYIMENKKCLKPPTSNMLLYEDEDEDEVDDDDVIFNGI
jgi:hypothetical protein